ncbi:MAG: glycosyltransferase [Nitrososphaerota archaeon]|nr:glycosyltransferase [Candidatus Bathyarchaeota archaeon]MDW8048707.1 glycosyltransferase [Nitrososphaerota archaeon]
MNIAIISPGYAVGGTYTTARDLFEGLRSEGFNAKILKLEAKNVFKLYEEWRVLPNLRKCDVVIFTGSNFWWNPLFIRSKKALFIHGFVTDEFLQSVMQFSLSGMAGRLPLIAYWKALKFSRIWDFFIFRSETSWERNGRPKDYVILPQFILPDDIKLYSHLQASNASSDLIRITTYTSFVNSPRLLSMEMLVMLAGKIGNLSERRIEFCIVSPIRYRYSPLENLESKNLDIRILPTMPRREFLKLLSSSDLFIERCTDEEIGISSIEAGLIGTPVAKITHTKYFSRQDYSDKEIILAKSPSELCMKISKYIININALKKQYANRMREFLVTKRSWDAVKSALLEKLN